MSMSKQERIEEIRIKLARLCHPDHYMNLRCDLPQMSVEGLGDLMDLLDEARVTERRLYGLRKRPGEV